LTLLVIEQAGSNGTVGRLLLGRAHGGGHAEATGVSLFPILVDDGLAHHVSHEVGLNTLVVVHPQLQRFGFGQPSLFAADEAVGLHAFDDVQLA